ncbi:triose-phosphate isomerase [bacterium]|jgi:triosephosphate isomerase|nr:triose-phosphate isomerase [bacterium]|tara:strand:+ start:1057 stop:1947 length:891 start_codon:yes stop_codon:yes gene_type:complete
MEPLVAKGIVRSTKFLRSEGSLRSIHSHLKICTPENAKQDRFMKNPLIIANWKMKLAPQEAIDLAKKVKKASTKYKGAEVVLCPSFTELAEVGKIIDATGLKLGAQDCFWEEQGAFTGEISPKILQEYGVETVIIGHSERRTSLLETSQMIHKKARLVLSLGMRPVVCVGESFDERQEGLKDSIIIRQVHDALNGIWLNKMDSLVVAYEPIWVIGSGQDCDPEEIEHTHQVIRQALYDLFTEQVVDEQVKIIYGGSVDPENVSNYLSHATVHGVLIGTASWDATTFSAVVAGAIKP